MFEKLVKIIFVLACWSCLAVIGIETERNPTTYTTENRVLTSKPNPPPTWNDLGPYLRQFESWWSDGIHYRLDFVRLTTSIYMKLGFNPPGEVLVGKDGWYFWTGERSGDAFRNNAPFTQEELQRWRNYLLFRHHDAEKHHAKYYFIVIPNKESAYAEFMPDNYTQLGKQSWLDQIMAAVAEDGIHIIDIRNTINENKKHAQLYTKTDTHWNYLGANYAQYDISQTLARDFPLLKPTLYPLDAFYDADGFAFVKSGTPYYTGLRHMLAMRDIVDELEPLPKQPIARCAKKAKIPLKSYWENIPEPGRSVTFHASSCDTGHYRVLFLRDSFTELLEPFMSEMFQYVAYIWIGTPLDMDAWTFFLEETQPDIVLDEIIGRYLTHIPVAGVDYPKDFQAPDRLLSLSNP